MKINVKKMKKTQHFEFDTKPSLFSGIIPKSQNFFMENKANFPTQRNTATTCSGSAYSNLFPEIPQKSKPNPNPISEYLQLIGRMDIENRAKTAILRLLPQLLQILHIQIKYPNDYDDFNTTKKNAFVLCWRRKDKFKNLA